MPEKIPNNGLFSRDCAKPSSFGLVQPLQSSPLKRYHNISLSLRAYSCLSNVLNEEGDAGGCRRRYRDTMERVIEMARGERKKLTTAGLLELTLVLS
jgi:hypothetical protein